jgi:hypothetical protein
MPAAQLHYFALVHPLQILRQPNRHDRVVVDQHRAVFHGRPGHGNDDVGF